MAEPGAPEHDSVRTGSQWTGSRIFLSLLDLDLHGLQVNLPVSESDDSSEAESAGRSVVRSFMIARELCVWLRQMGLAEVARHDCNVLQLNVLSRWRASD